MTNNKSTFKDYPEKNAQLTADCTISDKTF